jgi:hypothetical protein
VAVLDGVGGGEYGSRIGCQVWALVHVGFAPPLKISLPRATPQDQDSRSGRRSGQSGRQSETCAMVLLASFAAASFVSSGVSANAWIISLRSSSLQSDSKPLAVRAVAAETVGCS